MSPSGQRPAYRGSVSCAGAPGFCLSPISSASHCGVLLLLEECLTRASAARLPSRAGRSKGRRLPDWSMQRVEQLAPDAAAVKAAQGVAKPAKWQSSGHNERLLWGECRGSGANPYQVRIDLDDGAS